MKLIEPIDKNISHAFWSLGIEHITIIQKPKTLTPKIKSRLEIGYCPKNKTINIIVNDQLCILLHKPKKKLRRLIKKGGTLKKKKFTNKHVPLRKKTTPTRSNRKHSTTRRRKRAKAGNVFSPMLKSMLLFVTLFCFIIMNMNQSVDETLMTRAEYKKHLENFDPTKLDKYIDKDLLTPVDEHSSSLIAHWKSDGIVNMTTPKTFSVKEAPIVATLDFSKGYTDKFMNVFSHPKILFPGPKKIGRNSGFLPMQGLSRYFRVRVHGKQIKIIDRGESIVDSSDKDIESRRFLNFPKTSKSLNRLIDKTVIEQLQGILHTAHMDDSHSSGKDYWVAFTPMKLERQSSLSKTFGFVKELLLGKDDGWHNDPIPFLKRLGPKLTDTGLPYDTTEYVGDTFHHRDTKHITPYQGFMTFTYGRGVKSRSEANILTRDGKSHDIRNHPDTFPDAMTKVYSTIAKDRLALSRHSVASSDEERPVAALWVSPVSDDTEVDKEVFKSINEELS